MVVRRVARNEPENRVSRSFDAELIDDAAVGREVVRVQERQCLVARIAHLLRTEVLGRACR
jgi:hypothetical protein